MYYTAQIPPFESAIVLLLPMLWLAVSSTVAPPIWMIASRLRLPGTGQRPAARAADGRVGGAVGCCLRGAPVLRDLQLGHGRGAGGCRRAARVVPDPVGAGARGIWARAPAAVSSQPAIGVRRRPGSVSLLLPDEESYYFDACGRLIGGFDPDVLTGARLTTACRNGGVAMVPGSAVGCRRPRQSRW